ncbi:MAG: hypothetical protein ACI3T9_04445 [Romboutsia timonensis]
MKIENTVVSGIENALRVAGFPMAETTEKAANVPVERQMKVAKHLAYTNTGEAHDQFLTGITVTFDVTGSIQWWQEAERYRFLYFISSQSKMHRAHKMGINACCNKYVDEEIMFVCRHYQKEYNKINEAFKAGDPRVTKEDVDDAFYRMIYNIPSGFEYTAGMVTNYRQLKTIYNQRKNHRLQEWREFCKWIESLPESHLITGNYSKNHKEVE